VGRLVVIEGLDGAGKRTLVDALDAALSARGTSVARMAFPRYDFDVHAELARDALYGRLGDLAGSVHGMAVLFALDRRGAVEQLRALRCGHDVVLRRVRSSIGSVPLKSTGSASRCPICNCCCGCR
jgi:dTMP kinase